MITHKGETIKCWAFLVGKKMVNPLQLRNHCSRSFRSSCVKKQNYIHFTMFEDSSLLWTSHLHTFCRCYKNKHTFAAHFDQVTDALCLYLSMTTFHCSSPSLSSLIFNVSIADVTAQLFQHIMSRN